MNEYFKNPSFIAAAVILFSFFISYISVGDRDTLKFSASGVQLVTSGGSFSGKYVKRLKEKDKKKVLKEIYNKEDSFNTIDNTFSLLLFIGSGLLLFGAFKESKGDPFLNMDRIKYIKYGLLAITVMLFARYNWEIGIQFNEEYKIGIGLWLSLLGSIFLVFEEKIMEIVKSKTRNELNNNNE